GLVERAQVQLDADTGRVPGDEADPLDADGLEARQRHRGLVGAGIERRHREEPGAIATPLAMPTNAHTTDSLCSTAFMRPPYIDGLIERRYFEARGESTRGRVSGVRSGGRLTRCRRRS